MKSFWVFLLLAAVSVVLAEERQKPKVVHSAPAASVGPLGDSVASPTTVTEYKKTIIRKPKRSNGEIPLLIIRPVEKRRKVYFKEPTVKIASGGVATYGTYPELHTSDGEMFTLEHMLPILSLEGMLKGFPKHGAPVSHNHFVPSPQFKPSDIHHLLAPQKTKEEYHHQLAFGNDKTPSALKPSQLLSVSHKPSEAIPAQALPSPPPPNYVPAVNSEVQLLKLGQPQPSFSSLVSPQDKPAFVKPEQLPASFNFKVQQQEEVSHYKVNAIPLSKPSPGDHHHHHYQAHHHFPSGGATSYVGSQAEASKFSKPQAAPAAFHHVQSPVGEHQWHEVPKKLPQVSVSTNYYNPKTINAEQEHAQKPFANQATPSSTPTVQTHLSYYFPKEESAPQSHQVQHSPTSHGGHPHQATSYSNVQAGGTTGEQIEYVVQKAPSVVDSPAEKPLHKTYSSHIKQKYQKQHHHQQPHVFIQKYFEFPSSKNHQKNVVTEYHGTGHNDTTGDHPHTLPEPQAYAAPQYLPLPQPQALQQPQQHAVPTVSGPTAQTLHQATGHQHNVPQYHVMQPHHHHNHHHHHPGAQSYWKFGRRNQDIVKPVVENVHEQEPAPDSQHAASGAVIRQVKHTTVLATSVTTETPVPTKDSKDATTAQDRIDEPVGTHQQTANSTASTPNSGPTRTPKQIQNSCERRCIQNTVAVQTNEPVCGTDGVTYSNRGKLRCARTCGKDDLEIRAYGKCTPGKA
ncbi:inactive histone-lysine N-methyltransferase 2E-like [Anopheles ziemanni]|uniref:inactive histone-lysine N-methyltransferase 2E-like n=1 Tax=Anopheles coustani TaxID=139045 RepID=UPI0026595CAC|nr:inactive histone-lysine N-methyltransferase 2E-like [Anopheles coustani]XP_058178116.1 inactive histone-lysine N-methyltransferase 2E-like [Anopheles ziemanni]